MKRLVVSGVVLLFATPAFAQMGKNADVDKVRSAYMKAANGGDVAGIVALYTDDAVVMPPDQPMVKGKANIEAFQKGMFDMAKLSDVTITATDTHCMGDVCHDVGTYSQMVTPKGGKGFKEVGKYIVVLKKQSDGSWKLADEIWNADKAAPPMPKKPAAEKTTQNNG